MVKSGATGGGKRGGEGHSLTPYKRQPKAGIFFLNILQEPPACGCAAGTRRPARVALIRVSPEPVEVQPVTQINATAAGVHVPTPALPRGRPSHAGVQGARCSPGRTVPAWTGASGIQRAFVYKLISLFRSSSHGGEKGGKKPKIRRMAYPLAGGTRGAAPCVGAGGPGAQAHCSGETQLLSARLPPACEEQNPWRHTRHRCRRRVHFLTTSR